MVKLRSTPQVIIMESTTLNKPKVSSGFAQKELDKAEKQFEKFEQEVKDLTLDRMNAAPKLEQEQQTKISDREAQKVDGIWLKPTRTISSKEPFNEKYRSEFNFAKEYVRFIAEHKELIGEQIEKWTKEFAGQPAEYWEIPTNTVVWGPRYLAESIKKSRYHRLRMDENKVVGVNAAGTMTGQIVVDCLVQRLDAIPVSDRKSIFMGASGF
jgi:hypothetical protein